MLLNEGDEKDPCSGGGEGGGGEVKEGMRRVNEVRLNHSESVGVCLSAPLEHKQQRSWGVGGGYASPSC